MSTRAPEPIRPPALRPGDTVAVVSTSWGGAGVLEERFRRGLAALRGRGYQVRVMANALGSGDGLRDWVSGTREQRLDDLHGAFADPEVRLVLSAIGGNHAAQLLDGLDVELLRANPKLLCGYSDTTSLLAAVHAATGLVTFCGPALLPEWGEIGGPDAEVIEHFERLTGRAEALGPLPALPWQASEDRRASDAEGRPRPRGPGEPRRVLRAGAGEGPLLAACLPTLRALVGTPWLPELAGRVLLVEPPEAPYAPADADADLTHLRNAALLRDLAGLALGRSDGWDERAREQLHACALDAARGYAYPILAGVECSHSAPLLALPNGIRAGLEGTELVLLEPAVSPRR